MLFHTKEELTKMINNLITNFAHMRKITFVSPEYQINNSYQILDIHASLIKPFHKCLFYLLGGDIYFRMISIILP